jgi:hypothetical protein
VRYLRHSYLKFEMLRLGAVDEDELYIALDWLLDGVTGRRQPSWECGRPLHGAMNVKNFYLMELSFYYNQN